MVIVLCGYLQGRAVVRRRVARARGAGSHAGRGAGPRGGRRLTHARTLRTQRRRRGCYGGRVSTVAVAA